MYKILFVNHDDNEVLREMSFVTKKEMILTLIDLDLKIGDEFSIIEEDLKTYTLTYLHHLPFINSDEKGYQLFFNVSLAKKQYQIIVNKQKIN